MWRPCSLWRLECFAFYNIRQVTLYEDCSSSNSALSFPSPSPPFRHGKGKVNHKKTDGSPAPVGFGFGEHASQRDAWNPPEAVYARWVLRHQVRQKKNHREGGESSGGLCRLRGMSPRPAAASCKHGRALSGGQSNPFALRARWVLRHQVHQKKNHREGGFSFGGGSATKIESFIVLQ